MKHLDRTASVTDRQHPHGLLPFRQRHQICRDESLGAIVGLDLWRLPEPIAWPPVARLSRSVRRRLQEVL